MKISESAFLGQAGIGKSGGPDIAQQLQQFMARFHQSPLSMVGNSDARPKEVLGTRDRSDDEDVSSSSKDRRTPKIPDLIKFLADVPLPHTGTNRRVFLSLYLFVLVDSLASGQKGGRGVQNEGFGGRVPSTARKNRGRVGGVGGRAGQRPPPPPPQLHDNH